MHRWLWRALQEAQDTDGDAEERFVDAPESGDEEQGVRDSKAEAGEQVDRTRDATGYDMHKRYGGYEGQEVFNFGYEQMVFRSHVRIG